ncbi:MAG: hypothetical protein M0R77_12940 [Gammaproteobacteria bacterium]|nr:hypothetical protein [Gammaproteobacteria bacterium]
MVDIKIVFDRKLDIVELEVLAAKFRSGMSTHTSYKKKPYVSGLANTAVISIPKKHLYSVINYLLTFPEIKYADPMYD